MKTVRKLKIWNVFALLEVSEILYKCGKDMAQKYDLHHWNNSRFKNLVIVGLCVFKNNIYIVYDGREAVATFQTRKTGEAYLFQKLATSPGFAGGGIGSFCLERIEQLGKEAGCKEILCEVYDKSNHAKSFYEHRGYVVYGTTETLKYKELKLKKKI